MGSEKDMVLSTADLRKNLSDVIARAYYQGQVVDISNHGKVCAAIVSSKDAEIIKTKKKGGEMVSREEAELIKIVKHITGGDLAKLREKISKIVPRKGKGLEEIVAELEGTPAEPTTPQTSRTPPTTHRRHAKAA